LTPSRCPVVASTGRGQPSTAVLSVGAFGASCK
jgi:hypothetical protein